MDKSSDRRTVFQPSTQQLASMVFKFIQLRDETTATHSLLVAKFNRMIAVQFDSDLSEQYYHGGLVHDVGKIAMPDKILKGSGSLTKEERDLLFDHVFRGELLLRDIGMSSLVIDMTKYHHERFDGSGYGEGLVGKEIPLSGRITAISDTFSTLIEGRKYKPAVPVMKALDIMNKESYLFDPKILTWFINEIKTSKQDTPTINMSIKIG